MQLGEGVGAGHHLGHLVDACSVLDGDHGHDLLGQHVERVAGDPGLLDEARRPCAGRRRRPSTRSPRNLGKMRPLRRLADLVAGPADALQAAGHRRRRLHLHDEVDGAHVDAQLQAGGGDQRRQLARLEGVLDLQALLAGDRAVVGPHQLLAGQLVEPGGQPLGQPAGVDEDQRRRVAADQVEQHRVDGRPDRRAHLGVAGRRPDQQLARRRRRSALPSSPMSSTGHDDLELERLAHAGVDDGDRAGLARRTGRRGSGPARPAGAGWPTGRCAGGGRLGEPLQPLQRQGQVGAPLGGGDGVDLVDDHVLDRSPASPGPAR